MNNNMRMCRIDLVWWIPKALVFNSIDFIIWFSLFYFAQQNHSNFKTKLKYD